MSTGVMNEDFWMVRVSRLCGAGPADRSKPYGSSVHRKAHKSQLPVIEQALETAGLMLGSDKSRGYCLEMICADFLAGVSLDTENQNALLAALTRIVISLPKPQRIELLEAVERAP
jgi:hypothetical protein